MATGFLRTGMLCVCVLLGPNLIAATVIDFEGIPDSTPLGNTIPGLQFTNATVIDTTGLLNAGEFPPHSGIAVAFDDGGPMSIAFSSPVSTVSGYFTYGHHLIFTAFDSANILLASTQSAFNNNELLSGDTGSSPNELLAVSASSISRIVVTGDINGSSFVLDDLSYTSSPTNMVPEPSTSVMYPVFLLTLFAARAIRSRAGSDA
jgi:hypothetical protein